MSYEFAMGTNQRVILLADPDARIEEILCPDRVRSPASCYGSSKIGSVSDTSGRVTDKITIVSRNGYGKVE